MDVPRRRRRDGQRPTRRPGRGRVLSHDSGGLSPAGGGQLLLAGAGLTIAVGAFVLANEGFTRITSVRLVIASVVWTLLAEVLAHLTQRHRDLSRALRAAAQTDVLTGVGNRREIDLRLAACQRGDVVVICDLDHF